MTSLSRARESEQPCRTNPTNRDLPPFLARRSLSEKFFEESDARLRGRTATQRSKKGSEKVLGRVLRRVLRRGPAMGFTLKKGSEGRVLREDSEKGVSRRCLERPLGEYDPLGVRPRKLGWRTRVFKANQIEILCKCVPHWSWQKFVMKSVTTKGNPGQLSCGTSLRRVVGSIDSWNQWGTQWWFGIVMLLCESDCVPQSSRWGHHKLPVVFAVSQLWTEQDGCLRLGWGQRQKGKCPSQTNLTNYYRAFADEDGPSVDGSFCSSSCVALFVVGKSGLCKGAFSKLENLKCLDFPGRSRASKVWQAKENPTMSKSVQGATQWGPTQKRTQGECLQFLFPSPHEAAVRPLAAVAKKNVCALEWAPLSYSAWSWWLLQSWRTTAWSGGLLCGRVLSGRALWRLQPCSSNFGDFEILSVQRRLLQWTLPAGPSDEMPDLLDLQRGLLEGALLCFSYRVGVQNQLFLLWEIKGDFAACLTTPEEKTRYTRSADRCGLEEVSRTHRSYQPVWHPTSWGVMLHPACNSSVRDCHLKREMECFSPAQQHAAVPNALLVRKPCRQNLWSLILAKTRVYVQFLEIGLLSLNLRGGKGTQNYQKTTLREWFRNGMFCGWGG